MIPERFGGLTRGSGFLLRENRCGPSLLGNASSTSLVSACEMILSSCASELNALSDAWLRKVGEAGLSSQLREPKGLKPTVKGKAQSNFVYGLGRSLNSILVLEAQPA